MVACADQTTVGDTSSTSAPSTGSSPTSGPGASGPTSTGSGAGGNGGAGGGPSGEVRLIAIGDTGEGNTAQHCVADAMSAKCMQDGCDAILMTGDNFYKSGGNNGGVTSTSDPVWVTNFEQPYDRPGLNGLKFYAVLGNHDYSPTILQQIVGSTGVMQAEIDYSSLPVGNGQNGTRLSDKWTMPAQWYDVPFGNGLVHVFGFDSVNASDTSDDAQMADMPQRVTSSTATWKITFAHHPRYTSGDHALDNGLLNTLSALSAPSMYELQQAIYCDADVYLTGHDHNREIIDNGQDSMCPSTHFVISGAGSKTRASGASTVANSVYYDEAVEGFLYLVATPASLVVESYDSNPISCGAAGTAAPAFTFTITK